MITVSYPFLLNFVLFSASSQSSKPKGELASTETAEQSGSGSSVLDQLGCGSSNDFISKVAKLVSERIADANQLPTSPSFVPTDPNWRNYEVVAPTVTSDPIPSNSAPPLNFENPITENDFNDSFDQKKLLTIVPKQFKKKLHLYLNVSTKDQTK